MVFALVGVLGLLVVGGAVAGVVALRPHSSEEPAQSIDLGSTPQTEVKPEGQAVEQPATTTPPPETAAPVPAPAPVVHTTPKATAAAPKPTATATATATSTAAPTTTATQPTPSATATAQPSATSNGRLKLPPHPVFRFPQLKPKAGTSTNSAPKGPLNLPPHK